MQTGSDSGGNFRARDRNKWIVFAIPGLQYAAALRDLVFLPLIRVMDEGAGATHLLCVAVAAALR